MTCRYPNPNPNPDPTPNPNPTQAGSSYDIPKLTQQTFGKMRAADEIIDEGHFIGKVILALA